MYFKKRFKAMVIMCCIVMFLGGCASGPQFLPKQLENRPLSELAELNINGRTKDVYIDGEKVRGIIVYLMPGQHSIKYKTYGETETWKGLVKSMEAKGFTLSRNGEFVKTQGGYTTSANPLGVSRYGWNTESKEVSLEGGRKYFLTNL